MKPVQTLVLLANDREARFLENDGVGKGLRQVRHLDRATVSGEDIAYAGQPGRSQAAPGAARHGMEPSTSEEEQNRARFAADLAEMVGQEMTKAGHDRLILCAPPKMLGELRTALPKEVMDKLQADLDKDLIHTPLAELVGHFSDVAAF